MEKVPWYIAEEATRIYLALLADAEASILMEDSIVYEVYMRQRERATVLRHWLNTVGMVEQYVDIVDLPPPYVDVCRTVDDVRETNRVYSGLLLEKERANLPLAELLGATWLPSHSFG